MIQAIFFDFNGVIIDDERLQMAAYKDVLGKHGIALTESDYYGSLGMDDETFVLAAFERAKQTLSDDLLRTISEEKTVQHRKLFGGVLPLFPGVVTFLKATSRRYSLGVVSMATQSEIGYILDRAHLRSLFSVIVSTEAVGVCKPEPDCYLIGLKKLNEKRQNERLLPLLASECLVFEDSPPGIQAARAAGMRTIGVTNTVSESQLRDAQAEVVTSNLSDWMPDAVHYLFD
jgi:beta-phosphoglucomutase